MFYLEMQLIWMLLLILAASQLFTNALEHLGKYLGISAGVIGSIFAAIATALPETMVPIVALVAGGANRSVNEDVSVGAILGAPLMISTLSTFLMAVFAFQKRGLSGRISPEQTGFKRDLNFFLVAFFLAAVAMYLPLEPAYLRVGICLLLVGLYLLYIVLTFKSSKRLVEGGHGVMPDEPLFFHKLGFKSSRLAISIQLVLGLVLLLWGARGFIQGIEGVSKTYKISALLLSLLIIPIATELPEKINSILWVRKKKDTLAFGNLTGAMVFQGTLLPALGVLLTPWQPNSEVLLGIGITFLAAAWLRLNAVKEGVRITVLFGNGLLYFIYLYLTLA